VHAHGGQPSDLRACFDWTPIASLSSPSDNNVFMNRKPHAHTEQADNRATVHHHRALIKRSILAPKSFSIEEGSFPSHSVSFHSWCAKDARSATMHRCVMSALFAVLAASATRAQPAYDAAISEAHAGAQRNREILLSTAWRFPTAPPQGCNGTDVCHARNCTHCGCVRGGAPCPARNAPSGPASGCPNQVQCSALPNSQVCMATECGDARAAACCRS
jgi:hypothetical protein